MKDVKVVVCGFELSDEIFYEDFIKSPVFKEESDIMTSEDNKFFNLSAHVPETWDFDWSSATIIEGFRKYCFVNRRLLSVHIDRLVDFSIDDCISRNSTYEEVDKHFSGMPHEFKTGRENYLVGDTKLSFLVGNTGVSEVDIEFCVNEA